MTEREFRRKIKEASKLLNTEGDYVRGRRYGVCDVIDRVFGNFFSYYNDGESMASLFGEIFKPRYNRRAYWIGSLEKEENLDRRRLFLNLFEEYVVVNQYHLAF